MRATFVDLRVKSAQIIEALRRNESVTVFYRGKATAIMRPIDGPPHPQTTKAADHPAFGLWANRKDLATVAEHVRGLRRGRNHAL